MCYETVQHFIRSYCEIETSVVLPNAMDRNGCKKSVVLGMVVYSEKDYNFYCFSGTSSTTPCVILPPRNGACCRWWRLQSPPPELKDIISLHLVFCFLSGILTFVGFLSGVLWLLGCLCAGSSNNKNETKTKRKKDRFRYTKNSND